jgi:hypothetical protein
VVFGQDFISDVVNGTPPDTKLCKADDHDRNNDDGRIKAKTGCSEPACQDDANGQVAEGHSKVTAQEPEDISQVGSFRQMSPNKNEVISLPFPLRQSPGSDRCSKVLQRFFELRNFYFAKVFDLIVHRGEFGFQDSVGIFLGLQRVAGC